MKFKSWGKSTKEGVSLSKEEIFDKLRDYTSKKGRHYTEDISNILEKWGKLNPPKKQTFVELGTEARDKRVKSIVINQLLDAFQAKDHSPSSDGSKIIKLLITLYKGAPEEFVEAMKLEKGKVGVQFVEKCRALIGEPPKKEFKELNNMIQSIEKQVPDVQKNKQLSL